MFHSLSNLSDSHKKKVSIKLKITNLRIFLLLIVCHDVEKQIVWLPKSGAKIEDSTQWLKSNISKKIINYGDIWLYVWMGTCNL
jgi:hypothetical protein